MINANIIYLTEKALVMRDKIFAISILWENNLIGSLTENELSTLVTLFKKIDDNLPKNLHHK